LKILHFSGKDSEKQAPSPPDILNAEYGNYFVWGMRKIKKKQTIYVYDSSGVIATFPMSIYKIY